MSSKNVIKIILEKAYAEITSRWYIDFVIKKIRLFGSIDYWPSTEMYFVAIGLLERAKRMS